MSGKLIFTDSFGHYNGADFPAKYFSVGDNGIVVNSAIARTGTRCLQIISGAQGPVLLFGATHYTHMIGQVACKCDGPGVGQQFNVLSFEVNGAGYNIRVRVNGDSSLSVWRGNPNDAGSVSLFQTAFRPFIWGAWNYIQCEAVFDSINGSVFLNVNGRDVGSVTGVRTTGTNGVNFTDTFALFGTPGNGNLCYLADFVLIDAAAGGVAIPRAKVYVTVPSANAAPTDWTSLAGQNFANVNEIPPDGDTSYVFASAVGATDQYQHPAVVPAGATIAAYQHVLDGRVDSGTSPFVASDIAGTVGTGRQFTTSYLMYCNPQDGDPSPFPVAAGPKVTA